VATMEQLRELERWWSPSEAGRELETSGQWITHLARTGQVRGIKTHLGWLVHPDDITKLAKEKKKKQRAKKRRQSRQLQLA
jgi:hypothetical protein